MDRTRMHGPATIRKCLARLARQIERAAAWLLVPLILLQLLSGYAILHPRILGPVMGKVTAFKVHAMIQPLTVLAFVIHGFPSLRRGLARHRMGGKIVSGFLALFGTGLVAFAVYLWILG